MQKITIFLRTLETPDNFPKLPNRLEMIGDLKATFLLNRLLDPKSDLFKLVVIPKVEEVMTQIVDRDEKWRSPYPYNFLYKQGCLHCKHGIKGTRRFLPPEYLARLTIMVMTRRIQGCASTQLVSFLISKANLSPFLILKQAHSPQT